MLAMAAVIRLPMFRRRYAAAVLAGTSLPWLGNMLYLAGLDLAAPLAYWLGGLALSWGLYQIRLLNLVPIARSAIVENMPDGVMVLDDKDRIIDCNPAALQLLGAQLKRSAGTAGRRSCCRRAAICSIVTARCRKAQDEIVLNDRICELRIAPMSDRLGRTTGRLIMVRDVTERIRSADELDQRTAELQTILQAFPDLMFRLDENGRFLGYTASPHAHLYLFAAAVSGTPRRRSAAGTDRAAVARRLVARAIWRMLRRRSTIRCWLTIRRIGTKRGCSRRGARKSSAWCAT